MELTFKGSIKLDGKYVDVVAVVDVDMYSLANNDFCFDLVSVDKEEEYDLEKVWDSLDYSEEFAHFVYETYLEQAEEDIAAHCHSEGYSDQMFKNMMFELKMELAGH